MCTYTGRERSYRVVFLSRSVFSCFSPKKPRRRGAARLELSLFIVLASFLSSPRSLLQAEAPCFSSPWLCPNSGSLLHVSQESSDYYTDRHGRLHLPCSHSLLLFSAARPQREEDSCKNESFHSCCRFSSFFRRGCTCVYTCIYAERYAGSPLSCMDRLCASACNHLIGVYLKLYVE